MFLDKLHRSGADYSTAESPPDILVYEEDFPLNKNANPGDVVYTGVGDEPVVQVLPPEDGYTQVKKRSGNDDRREVRLDRSGNKKLGVTLGNSYSEYDGIPVLRVDPESVAYGQIEEDERIWAINGNSVVGMTMEQAAEFVLQSEESVFMVGPPYEPDDVYADPEEDLPKVYFCNIFTSLLTCFTGTNSHYIG